MDKKITANIPVRLKNTPKGVSEGGILQQIRRELSVSCLPDKLIDFIEVDVEALDIGDALHIGDIEQPEGIAFMDEAHLTVVVVAAPTVKETKEIEEEEGEEGAEGAAEGEAAASETESAEE